MTESVAAEPEDAIRRLDELRDMSVELAVDDFGTGLSSLNRLLKLPFTMLKIDKTFVDEIEGSDESDGGVAIIESIIQLSHRLDMTVVAEGVETNQQLDYLRELGCDFIQRFLLGKPVAIDDFRHHVLARS